MPNLHIIYDPSDTVRLGATEEDVRFIERNGILHARMPVAEHLQNTDVYELARKLAELLLEQLA